MAFELQPFKYHLMTSNVSREFGKFQIDLNRKYLFKVFKYVTLFTGLFFHKFETSYLKKVYAMLGES